MKLLLEDRWAPTTSEIGFLEVDCERASSAFCSWQRRIAPAGMTIRSEKVSEATLEGALARLLPLTSVIATRFLFLPTQGRWTAFLDNGYRGTDPMPPMSFLAKELQCRGLRTAAVPNTMTTTGRGRFGATVLEVYGPTDGDFLNYERCIAAVNDGGRWTWVETGTPLSFEEPRHYANKAVRARFTPEMLEGYLRQLGIDAFDESFYVPTSAVLVEKGGKLPDSVGVRSLEEARAAF